MKRFIFPVIILAILASGIAPVHAQKKEKKEEEFKKLTALIESGQYEFSVQSVNPSGGKTIHPSTVYTMTADQGAFKAYLPYFGRAYQASYGGNGGIEFDGEPEEVEITRNEKKRNITVSFKISGENDRYTVSLQAGSTGYGTLNITCQKRQPISYYGSISALKSP